MIALFLGLILAVASPAAAASIVILDSGGIDQVDVGGGAQFDITGTTHDGATFGWAWDETAVSGNNSLDTCSYFKESDGSVTAVCYTVTFEGGAVKSTAVTVYDCGTTYGGGKCTGNPPVSTQYAATCSTPTKVAPYFKADPDQDLQVTCTLTSLDGSDPTTLKLINTCSKGSSAPSSVSNDCLFDPNKPEPGYLQVRKVVVGGSATAADFTVGATLGTSSITGAGDTGLQTVIAGTWNLNESSSLITDGSYTRTGISCTTEGGAPVDESDGTVVVSSLKTTICTITNTVANGTLSVTKIAQGAPSGATFTIAYTCTKNGVTTASGTFTYTAAGGTKSDPAIPSGSSCAVSETAPGYDITIATSPVTVAANTTASVTVTNTRQTQNLTITKKVVGGSGTFTFDVACTGPGGETFTATGVTVVVGAGGTASTQVSGVPTGLTCQVTEVNIPTGYTPDALTKTAVDGAVTFTNTGAGSLAITKKVVGGPAGAIFDIAYDCSDGTTGSVSLGDGQSKTIDSITGGASCAVTETVAGYDVAIATSPVTVTAGARSDVVVTNTRQMSTLKINKVAVGGTATFTFNVVCNGDGPTTTAQIIGSGSQTIDVPVGVDCTVTEVVPEGWDATGATQKVTTGAAQTVVNISNVKRGSLTIGKVNDGGDLASEFTIDYDCGDPYVGSVTLKGGDMSTIAGLPAGVTCTFKERAATGYSAEYSPSTGKVTVAPGVDIHVIVTNTRDLAPLVITKTAVGGDNGDVFTFDVTCTGPGGETFSRTGVTVTVDAAGVGSTSVKVPTGLTCSVTEQATAGWINDGAATQQGTPGGDPVAFHNTKEGALTITKKQVGGASGLSFDISYDCGSGHSGTLTLAAGQTSTPISGIPAGTTCTVSENAEGFTAVLSPSTLTVPAGGTLAVTVTNTRDLGTFTVNKSSVGGDGTFAFHVVCSDADETITRDVDITTTSGAGTAVLKDIPTGLSCTVTEPDLPGWTESALSQTAKVGAAVTFTNTKNAAVELTKFYDANANGVRDSGEPTISGWQMRIGDVTYTTGSNGSVTASPTGAGPFTVTEGTASPWVATAGLTRTVTNGGSASFGNVCLGDGGGKTIGFWRNRNGNRLLGSTDLAMLTALHLVGESGAAFDPASVSAYNAWLGSARAVNMAYMLSAQLSATALGVHNDLIDPDQLVYAPGVSSTSSFVTVAQLITAADAALAADANTPSGDANRARQELLMKALDGVNNGLNVVQATPCPTPGAFTW